MTTTQNKKIPQGYKMTELGVIPEDWEIKKLGNIGIPYGGLTGKKKEDFGAGNAQFITFLNVMNNTRIDIENFEKVKIKSGECQNEARKGDIFFNTSSETPEEVGMCAVLLDNIKGVYLNSFCFGYRLKDIKKIDGLFLSYFINSEYGRELFASLAQGATRYNMSKSHFNKLEVGFPGHEEQKAIATALSDTDRMIGKLDKLIAKKKLIKQGAMQELLTGGRRLSRFNEEWEVKKLGNIGTPYGGLTGKKKEDFGDGNAKFITFLNVMNNIKIDIKNFEKVKIKNGECQNEVRKGDLFFNTSSETPEEVGMCAVLLDDINEVYLNSFCFGYRLKDIKKIDGLFLSYFMNSEYGRDLFVSLAQGATRYNLSKSHFNKLEIEFPLYEEQKAITKILSDIDSEIEKLEKKKEKYQMIKEGAMQVLLTGKIRLV